MWKNKNVWILLLGEFIAGLGLWLGIIGNLEFMQAKVPSDFVKSLILASGILAGLAVGPLAGRITDQVRKKTVMLIAGFFRSVSVLIMLIAIETNSVIWMIVFLVSIQISAAFYFPALQAAIPLIVKEKDLLQLNAIHMNVSTLSRIAGTAIAGLFVVIMSLSTLYLLSLIAYLGLFIITWFLTINETVSKTTLSSETRKKGGFKEVFPIIKGLPIVFMTLVMTLIPLLFIGGFNLIVINISELQDSASIKGWIYATEGIAFMTGAFIVKRISGKLSPYKILFGFSFVIGISQLMLYFAQIPWMTVLVFAIFGFSVGCFFPTASTIFQTRVPKEFHGRFFSFKNMLDRFIFQVVLLLTGSLLDLIGLQLMGILLGILSIVMTSFFFSKFKQYRKNRMLKEAS
ncbi:MFS transporter [Bacillus spongiae]|uniref:MFS transporter n=1 Tax=Bacillus spongiae TaxID=2683610 RepID=A0ABU8HEU8_9BACI